MEFISGLKSEVFRPIATTVVPGAVALVPYVFVAEAYSPKLEAFGAQYPEAFVALILMGIIATGFTLESIGSRIETLIWDRMLEKKYPGHNKQWEEYLALTLKDEIIGQRYLDRIVISLKFELAFTPALVFLAVGLNWLNHLKGYWSSTAMGWMSVVIGLLLVYSLYESYGSADVSSKTRRLILDVLKK